jgi:two-component system response regulator AtoC
MAHDGTSRTLTNGHGADDHQAPLFEHSRAMRTIKEAIGEIGRTDAPVLIRGESGVGKDVVARTIHEASDRCRGPFVKVNCAAIPGELMESEVFGHEKGAFTGAYRRKLGRFEFAQRGTILLDEIGDLPQALQPKLLHVLQEHEFSRVGGRELIRLDARVISSTNRNLEAALLSGGFREDLYYRLNVVELWIPPLRERKDEIRAFAAYFLARANAEYGRQVEMAEELLPVFEQYSWPGNIRELENVVRRVVVLGNAAQVQADLLARIRATATIVAPESWMRTRDDRLGLREIARSVALEAERKALLEVLDQVRWNRTEAARILKVSYKTLLNKIAGCGLASPRKALGNSSRRSAELTRKTPRSTATS